MSRLFRKVMESMGKLEDNVITGKRKRTSPTIPYCSGGKLNVIGSKTLVPKASPHETKRNRYTMMMLTNAIPTMRNTCDLSRIGVTMLGKLWWHMNEYTTPPKRFGSALQE
jgi:hypothetical protein